MFVETVKSTSLHKCTSVITNSLFYFHLCSLFFVWGITMHRKFTWVLSLLGRYFQWRHKTGAVNSRPFLLQVVLIAEPFWTYLATWNNYNVYVWTMCIVCMHYCMYELLYYELCVLYVWTMYIVCMNYCMYELYVLYIWTMCIVCMNYVYCMYELYVLYVHQWG